MNKERRVGRRSVVQNLVKLTPPEFDNDDNISRGPKKALFNDDTSFVMRRTLKPLHEINNFQYSSTKSKSHEKLYEIPNSSFIDVFDKYNKVPISPPSRMGLLELSMVKNLRKPSEPILQSKDLFNTLIDSPCTKFEKVQYNNALSSASKFLLNRHLESVQQNSDIFKEETTEVIFENKTPEVIFENKIPEVMFENKTPEVIFENKTPEVIFENKTPEVIFKAPKISAHQTDEKYLNELKTPHLIDLSITPKQNMCQSDFQTQTLSIPFIIEEIKELKKNEIEDIRQTKLHCCDFFKTKLKEIELEIEEHFGVVESKVTENYDVLLKKIQDGINESVELQSLDTTVETVKENNYTRMTGACGIFNNLNTDCSFLKTPKTKGKTRAEMLNKGILTPSTMSFVCQEQLMHLNSNT